MSMGTNHNSRLSQTPTAPVRASAPCPRTSPAHLLRQPCVRIDLEKVRLVVNHRRALCAVAVVPDQPVLQSDSLRSGGVYPGTSSVVCPAGSSAGGGLRGFLLLHGVVRVRERDRCLAEGAAARALCRRKRKCRAGWRRLGRGGGGAGRYGALSLWQRIAVPSSSGDALVWPCKQV